MLLGSVIQQARDAADRCDADPTLPPLTAADYIAGMKKTASAYVATHPDGPKIPEGKERSSQNSFKHGLCAGSAFETLKFLPGENSKEYYELCGDLYAQFRPRTRAETLKLDDMAMAWFLQRRARNLQTDAINHGDTKSLGLYLRYEVNQRRSYQMAYKDFRDMQSQRELRKDAGPDQSPVVLYEQSTPAQPQPSDPAPATATSAEHQTAA
jgi:hypothetical protein